MGQFIYKGYNLIECNISVKMPEGWLQWTTYKKTIYSESSGHVMDDITDRKGQGHNPQIFETQYIINRCLQRTTHRNH